MLQCMQGFLVVLTGASGSGKTTLAEAMQVAYPEDCEVFFFDSIGVPSAEAMQARYGDGHQPGGAWQRAMTLQWINQIAAIVRTGKPVLFEGQMRIAFIREALAAYDIVSARIVLVDCNDVIRRQRLCKDRAQPDLANAQMMGWAQYLREEATQGGCEILDTGTKSCEECVELLHSYLLLKGVR